MVPSDEPAGQSGVINVRLARLAPILAYGLVQLLDADPRFHVANHDEQWRPGAAVAVHVVVSGLSPAGAEPFAAGGFSPAPTLIVAHSAESSEIDRSFQAGVLGYVLQDAALATILEAIEQVARGRRFVVDHPAEARAEAEAAPTAHDVLSPRELQVLTCIALGRTHYQVARTLGISAHTVDTYVKRARNKLGLGNKADLTRAVLAGRAAPQIAASGLGPR